MPKKASEKKEKGAQMNEIACKAVWSHAAIEIAHILFLMRMCLNLFMCAKQILESIMEIAHLLFADSQKLNKTKNPASKSESVISYIQSFSQMYSFHFSALFTLWSNSWFIMARNCWWTVSIKHIRPHYHWWLFSYYFKF